MVGDLDESYPDVAERSFNGGGYDQFAVSDVGGANEKRCKIQIIILIIRLIIHFQMTFT